MISLNECNESNGSIVFDIGFRDISLKNAQLSRDSALKPGLGGFDSSFALFIPFFSSNLSWIGITFEDIFYRGNVTRLATYGWTKSVVLWGSGLQFRRKLPNVWLVTCRRAYS